MKLIDVPHYKQCGKQDCQAAAAAMIMDFWDGRTGGGDCKRFQDLLAEFSCGFEGKSGDLPPAITGLVALAIAKKGLSVEFFSKNPGCDGTQGLSFLRHSPYDFSDHEIDEYSSLASSVQSTDRNRRLNTHPKGMSEHDFEAAIKAGRPVVAIVDAKILRNDRGKHENHAVVIIGIDKESVTIQDPADDDPQTAYDRNTFFEAHNYPDTDDDSYLITKLSWYRRATKLVRLFIERLRRLASKN